MDKWNLFFLKSKKAKKVKFAKEAEDEKEAEEAKEAKDAKEAEDAKEVEEYFMVSNTYPHPMLHTQTSCDLAPLTFLRSCVLTIETTNFAPS